MKRWLRRLAVAVPCLIAAACLLAALRGYGVYVVRTGSMVPTYRPGDAVLDAPPPAALHPGQVVTFASASGPDEVVTHRVHDVTGPALHTKGDANRTPDPWTVTVAAVRGTPVMTIPWGGYALVYLRQPAGAASVATVAVVLVLAWQLYFPGTRRSTT